MHRYREGEIEMARTYNIELECGCLLSADGGGGMIPCAAGFLGYCPDYVRTAEDLALEKKCSEAWSKFKESGELDSYERECTLRNL
jgi:hypothetical protein